uniref:Uncharacterized protein n=1 Tax=Arundo donax TaxID=35708 RepID=A0A0A9HLS5_ARUDO
MGSPKTSGASNSGRDASNQLSLPVSCRRRPFPARLTALRLRAP